MWRLVGNKHIPHRVQRLQMKRTMSSLCVHVVGENGVRWVDKWQRGASGGTVHSHAATDHVISATSTYTEAYESQDEQPQCFDSVSQATLTWRRLHRNVSRELLVLPQSGNKNETYFSKGQTDPVTHIIANWQEMYEDIFFGSKEKIIAVNGLKQH